MISRLGLAMTFALLSATPGLAAGKRGNADLRRFCSVDAATFCGDLDPHSKKMDACFAAHRRELSDNCRRAIDAYQARGGK